MSVPRLEVVHASKTFGGTRVLIDASLTVAPGEIHGLVGQNGSGKSTLIKIISGVHHPDQGAEIRVDGLRVGPPVHPARLAEAGVAFVHQDLGLVRDLTVRDNVRVGRYTTRTPARKIDRQADARIVARTLDYLGIPIDPEAIVSTLLPSERAAVAVARALQDRTVGSGVVVFDEATRAIPRDALPSFYALVRRLAAEGTAVVIVSHHMKEILELTDRVTVLRNGSMAATNVSISGLTEADLTRLVLGKEGDTSSVSRAASDSFATPSIIVRDARGGRVTGLSFGLAKREVVGLIGASDSGLDDVPALLSGAARGSGSVHVGGRSLDIGRSKIVDFLAAGVALIPQARLTQGIAPGLSVTENVTLPRVRRRGRPWRTGRGWQRAEVIRVQDMLGVVPRLADIPVAHMSGGNQQKIMFGKWLLGSPQLLIAHEPTQAVDVGARVDILRAVRHAANEGAAVLYCSVETEDLAAVCDRVLVMDEGIVVREIRYPFTSEDILLALYPQKEAS